MKCNNNNEFLVHTVHSGGGNSYATHIYALHACACTTVLHKCTSNISHCVQKKNNNVLPLKADANNMNRAPRDATCASRFLFALRMLCVCACVTVCMYAQRAFFVEHAQ